MNKKKLIFLALLGFFVIIIIIVAVLMAKNTDKNNKSTTKTEDFTIWILEDSKDDFNVFLDDFKSDTDNQNLIANIETFSNYEEYNMALSSAIVKGQAPDLYMLNNNEKSIFLENATGLDPEILSPDILRKYFYSFFWDDLIYSSGEKEEKTEFLVWVPFGFETLWLYFNPDIFRDVKKLKSFPEIENLIEEFHQKKPESTALWIGKWLTVSNVANIFIQFLMSEWVNNLEDVNSSNIKKVFTEYFSYNSWNNGYIKADNILRKQWKTNVDFFIDWKIAMIFGFPRLLNEIDDKWLWKRKIRAVIFPDFINESNRMVNYNYFVLNKDSKNNDMAYEILKYMFSEKGEKAYLNNFKYYLPARISLYADLKDREVNENFYVKLKDFYNSEAIYSSFDKWLKPIFDKEIINLLDDEVNYLKRAWDFISSLKCKTLKVIKLENLSNICE